MVREFKLPDVGEGVAEGEIVGWLVEEGDTVSEDQPVAEVETDKAIVEVPSPFNGTVREILAEEGEVVPVGTVIITFNVEGEDEEPTESKEETAEEPEVSDEEESADTGGRVFAAPSARRLARELGVDIAAVEGTGPSGRVTDQDVRSAAEGSGEPEVEETEETAEPAEAGSEPAAGQQPQQTAQQQQAADRDRTLAAPATRKLAAEKGVDLNAVPATEERDGEAFVTPEAVTQYAEAQQRAQAADAAAVSGEPGPLEERIQYKGVRKAIGDQMEQSKYTAPHVTHHDTVEVTNLVETRAELKPVAEEQGVKLTYMPFIMKALVAAMKEFPYLNSTLDEENEEIVLKNYYNIGIAVATDAGLMVPVVKNVDGKDMLQLASEVNELAQKARDRTISMEEMQGGTFTITNFGAIGGEYATPIINYPEVAIMGLGAIDQRPVAEDGKVVARDTLPMSLSIDHRIIDGAVAGQFTNKVMEYLENPNRLLLE